MLHLAGCIAFGMDVADFFKLKRTFQGDRIVSPPAEIEHIAGFGDAAGNARYIANLIQHRCGGRRNLQQGIRHSSLAGCVYSAALAREGDS